MIIVTKLHPTLHLHNSNQAKQIITSNAKNESNEPTPLILVLMNTVSNNEGSC